MQSIKDQLTGVGDNSGRWTPVADDVVSGV